MSDGGEGVAPVFPAPGWIKQGSITSHMARVGLSEKGTLQICVVADGHPIDGGYSQH